MARRNKTRPNFAARTVNLAGIGGAGRPRTPAELLASRILAAAGWLQGDRHHLEQVVAAE